MIDKIKKIAVVIFLTLLIWAWAYLALEEEIIQTATLDIAPPASLDSSATGTSKVTLGDSIPNGLSMPK